MRQGITDKSGRWFDTSKATLFKEESYWDGRNNISKATGSQWEHEYLYRSASGTWILNKYSDYMGSVETYEIIGKNEAAEWFLRQSADLPSELEELSKDYEV
jgi:hypothetical protein